MAGAGAGVPRGSPARLRKLMAATLPLLGYSASAEVQPRPGAHFFREALRWPAPRRQTTRRSCVHGLVVALLSSLEALQHRARDFGERNILAADFEVAVIHECVLRRSDAARGARPDQVHLTVRKLSGLNHRCSEFAEV